MNHRRIDALEQHFQLADDDPGVEMMRDVAASRRFHAWLAEQGYPDDPHAALAAGLRTPPGFRYATLEELAHAAEYCTIYRWVAEWGYVLQARQRLADPRYDTDYFREHLNSQIERCTRDAQEARAKLARWGIGIDDALARARAMYTEPQHNGARMTDEEFERITAAILAVGQGGASEQ
jgi:hypothetical protein